MKNIAIYEGDSYKKFYPFTINHATFEIRTGSITMLDDLCRRIKGKLILVVRDSIKDLVTERYPDAAVNPDKIPDDFCEIYLDEELDNPSLFSYVGFAKEVLEAGSSELVSKSAKVSSSAILDSSGGSIIIDDNALVDIGALIKGPVYIGKNSIINPGAKLKDVVIGPYCKIGGEVEHTTFHGYSNKQHDGYLGHTYVGEWVNLGANTNNSDLKNNYSNIRVNMGDREIDAGMFAGCLIGDYTKTGISTMINTGTYIGLGCNIFGAGFQNKYIPNFSWGMDGDKTDFDKFIQTLKIVKARRDKEITSAELELLKNIYENKI
tara:strand:- start:577 stop:1539 length:963 start_codon:yes stop_codon:yes gene_type:complete